MSLLEVSGLVVDYKSHGGGLRRPLTRAVSNVDLQVDRGEVLAVVGESGSGKTTVARVVAGLVRASSGSVLLGGEALPSLRQRTAPQRSAIQMVFQDPRASLNPRRTIAQSIAESWSADGRERPTDTHVAVARLLESVGLDPGLASRYPGQVSGGQCQRVSIARALASRPSVLICDEAVSALDVTVQAQVLRLLDELRTSLGIAVLFITHDLGVVRQLADRVVVMTGGAVVESGPVRKVLDQPTADYTRQLLRAALDLP